jgi:hypothetical protein
VARRGRLPELRRAAHGGVGEAGRGNADDGAAAAHSGASANAAPSRAKPLQSIIACNDSHFAICSESAANSRYGCRRLRRSVDSYFISISRDYGDFPAAARDPGYRIEAWNCRGPCLPAGRQDEGNLCVRRHWLRSGFRVRTPQKGL